MGKQKGDGGRSKNRPSSSSLAASLLPSGSSAAAVGFGGYVGSSRFDVPVSVDDSAPFLDVDSEVAQHLKRLARKDPVTKLKALQALSALFKVKSGKDIALIIPQWAFEYKRLLLDYNREVRRATHETMTNLVVTVGRDIAPHLKSLMGPWWFSQFDPVSEVSLAAKRSLQAAFPAQEKRLDAFILCTTEIFLYLEENLKLTPQSLSDKAVALDELEDMYHQAIASTLLALATLIDVLFSLQSETAGLENVAAEPRNASKARATATSFAEKLFSGHKYFLDFLKSQNSAVRTAAYSTLKSFIKSVPHVFNDQNMRTVAVAVFGAFQEKDPACYSSIWDTVLLFSKRFPDSWTMINVQKNFLARFWNFLRHQCFGSQQVSYPSLILFLESVPSNVAAGERFFLDFFQNLWDGRNPLRSAVADRSAFFKAFRECFLFALQNAPSAILGGSSNDDQIFFVSKNIIISIVKMFSKRLFSFVAKSSFESVRDSGSVLNAETDCAEIGNESSVNTVEMAQSSLRVLRNSFFCLKPISEDSGLVSGMLASIFIIKWEFEMMKMEEHATNDESNEKMIGRREVCQVAHDLCLKEKDALCKSLPANIRMKLGNLLVQSIRLVIHKELKLSASMLTSLCCSWMGELLASLCLDETEEQTLLDQLLSKDQNWPSWIVSDFTGGSSSSTFNMENDIHVSSMVSCNVKLVSLIDKLIKRVGINKVLHLDDNGNVSLKEPLKEETTTRAWLAAEILCTWNWIDGAAVDSFLPSLVVSAKAGNPCVHNLLDGILDILLNGALVQGERGRVRLLNVWPASNDELGKIEEPFLRALLTLVVTLLNDGIWGRGKATELFKLLITKLYIGESVNTNCLRILPSVINVLIQSLCRRGSKASESTKDNQLDKLEQKLQDILKDWLHRTLMFPPLVEWTSGQDMEEWIELVIACYPLSLTPCSKSLKLERDISLEEKTLVLDLFRKQKHRTTAVVNQLPVVRILLSELLVISVGYCWKQFAEDDWEFFFSQIRSSIQSVVVIMEESAESVNDVVSDGSTSETSDVLKKLDQLSSISDASAVNVASNALASFSLFCGAVGLKSVNDDSNSIVLERWNSTVDRLQEAILRLFFCTGISEAISSTYSDEAASVVAKSRCCNPLFWQLVASNVINSSPQARERAVKSVEFWGLSTGSISSLYAILFSSIPIPALQHAAYVVLSTEPVSQLAVVNDSNRVMDDVSGDDQGSSSLELSSEKNVNLAEELSLRIEKPSYDVLEINLMAHERVNLFLSWSLLLSHLGSLPTPSPAREQLVQYVQGSGNSVILDCIFQHIPLEECSSQILKKKDAALPPDASEAARAASRAITTGSLLFAVESLWPIGPKNMATLAGALYGFMLRVLPAYVRGWFSELRDRSISSLIESFTRTWCSPALIVKELSQIKKADFADEIFSVSVSKSANEVVATYTKEETGMDLVIRLPASYPLRHVDVDCMRSLGISEVKQRKWLMSMTMFVRNQNGALAEAIRTWKSNLDKEFQGVEECPICYSVIHTDNRSLPRLACRTCKHKFHSACLYKWFSTSHKSSCPLCQSPF
ncbi:E3 ubiquitin-protein ligase listerin [Linum perenne]